MRRKRILSIDGGGIRGIIPASALVKLEADRNGQLTREMFDFVAGTSTGAIIAAAVAAGIPARDILNLYLTRSSDIFAWRPWWPPDLWRWLVHGHKYKGKTLHDVLSQELKGASNWILNDSKVDLLITAKRVPDGEPWYFVKNQSPNSTGELKLIDCTTASASAPTYFDPWSIEQKVKTSKSLERVGELVDGGVGVAGNPVYQACVEAFVYSQGYAEDNTLIVSLGTGRYLQRKPTWLLKWLTWSVDQLLESPGEQQTALVNRHYPNAPLYRIDVKLKQDIGLDAVKSVDLLKSYGESLAQSIDWNQILDGGASEFLIRPDNTRFEQYAKDSAPKLQ
jgi:patatin-like phospholipase/acyl hydrolase